MSAPRLSILLPVHNGGSGLVRLLAVLGEQRCAGGVERLATDTESGDGSDAELVRAGFALERIARADFGHGRTRNALAARARGEILVFFSQDAEPEGADFLERLCAPLADARVDAVCARLVPRRDDDALTARSVLAAREGSERALEGLEAARAFHNVAAAYRASALRLLPFPELAFGEDAAWAAETHARGRGLRLEPRALVRHSHRYSCRAAFERFRVDAAFHRRRDGTRLRPGPWSVVRGLAFELRADWRHVRAHGGAAALWRAPCLRGAQVLGQYWGSRGWRNPFPGAEPTREMV